MIEKILIVEDALSKNECDNLISSTFESSCGEILTDTKNNKTNYTDSVWVCKNLGTNNSFLAEKLLERIIIKYAEPFFDVTMEFWNRPSLFKYETGGFFVPHVDGEIFQDGKWVRIYDRDYTITVFLNEDYEGGNIIFPDYDLHIVPKTGKLIVFPNDHNYFYGDEKVTSGNKYQLVSWLTAYGTKRTKHPENPFIILRSWM
jgi:predicted 2-oxoglutarate/Fe(II)-dependent dioxygenase YbiX